MAEIIPELLIFVTHASSHENASVYKRALGHFLRITGNMPLDSVSPKHVDQFKTKRSQEVSAVTLNLELRTLRAAFNIALRWSYIQANPFSRVKLCRIDEFIPAFPSVTEFKKIISDLPNDWFRQIVIVAAMTGMRRGELTHLCWDDVQLDRGIVVVQSRGDYRVKSGKRRIVPLNPIAMRALEERWKARKGEFVFHQAGKKILDRRVTKRFKRRLRRLQLDPKIHFHSLRHGFASWLLQSGAATIYEVQKLLGHATIKTTEIYAHLLPDQLRAAVDRIPVTLDQF